MNSTHPKLYFAISNRDGENTNLQGNSIFSIQDLKDSYSLQINQKVKDPKTGEIVKQSTPMPALNYETSVKYADPFRKEALVTITHHTKNGPVVTEFRINRDNPCATYIDENYVIKFGIDDFESIFSNTPVNEKDSIIKRNAEKIKELVGLAKISVLTTGSSQPEDELSK